MAFKGTQPLREGRMRPFKYGLRFFLFLFVMVPTRDCGIKLRFEEAERSMWVCNAAN